MDNSDTIHKLADTTYRNVDELTGNLKKLLSITKNLARAMEDIIPISEEFTAIIDSVGSKAANLPGGVRNLGVCLKEMATANRKIGASFSDWTTSLTTDLVVPLEDKLDRETPEVMKSWKSYKSETSKKETAVEKTSKNLKAIRKKKSTMENIEKETQLCQILEDQQRDLHSARVEGLRKALIDQQKLYSFFIFHLCGVHHSQIEYASTAYQSLSMKVNDWMAVTSNSTELPQESLVLLKNPHSPDAYKIPGQDRPLFNFPVGGVNSDPLEEVDMMDTEGRIRAGSLLQDHSKKPHPVTAADVRNIKAESQPTNGHLKRRTSCRVKALHSFTPNEQGRLGLKAGDLIDAVGEEKDGWMYGTHSQTKESGWFPSQYVDKVWAATPEPPGRKKIMTSSSQPKQTLAPELPERDYISGGKSPVIRRKMQDPTPAQSTQPPSQLTSSVPAPPTPSIPNPPPPAAPPIASAPPPAPPMPTPTGPPPPPAPPTSTPQNNPPKKQLSFADMIKQRSSYVDSD